MLLDDVGRSCSLVSESHRFEDGVESRRIASQQGGVCLCLRYHVNSSVYQRKGISLLSYRGDWNRQDCMNMDGCMKMPIGLYGCVRVCVYLRCIICLVPIVCLYVYIKGHACMRACMHVSVWKCCMFFFMCVTVFSWSGAWLIDSGRWSGCWRIRIKQKNFKNSSKPSKKLLL